MKNYGEQLKNGLRKYKRIIAAFIIVFISVVVELAANIQALRGGYDSLDISQNISIKHNFCFIQIRTRHSTF